MTVIPSSLRRSPQIVSLSSEQMGLHRTQEKTRQPFAVTSPELTDKVLIVLLTTNAPVRIVMHSSSNEFWTNTSPILRE